MEESIIGSHIYSSKQCMRKLRRSRVRAILIITFVICLSVLIYMGKYTDIEVFDKFRFSKVHEKNFICPKCECVPQKKSDDFIDGISESLSQFESYYTQRRLQLSSQNWMRSHVKRYKTEKYSQIPYTLSSNFTESPDGRNTWDYFTPSFSCPYTEERVGRVGDGGKWICGFRELGLKKNCIVYSFGVNLDTSFEEEILIRTKCLVRMFDPTISNIPQLVHDFPERATFEKLGLSHEDTHASYSTLKSIMNKYGDTYIEVLKIDIDGGEWGSVGKVVENFDVLPFGQLAIEVHLNQIESKLRFVVVRTFWYMLEKAGLRAFHEEPNIIGSGLLFNEYSFINLKSKDFEIKKAYKGDLTADESFEKIFWTLKNKRIMDNITIDQKE